MKTTTDTPVEEDISDIDQDIIERFRVKDIRQVARETGLAIDVVNRRLKTLIKKDLAARVKNSRP